MSATLSSEPGAANPPAGAATGSLWPVRKVAIGAAAGALAVILIFLYNRYVSPNAPLPADVATAVTTLVSTVLAWLVPSE